MPAGEAPTAASAPNRRPLIIGAVALIFVIAAGYLGYRALYGGSKPEPVAVAEPQKPAEPPALQAAEPAKDTSTPAAPASAETATTAQEPTKTASTATTAPDSLPGTPAATPKAGPRPKPAPRMESVTTEAAPAAPVPSAKPSAKAVAVAAAPTPVETDRWQMYADALGRCAREDFFKRLGCELRTRNQYCQGYWGQVPQCPEAMPRERGQ